MDTEINKVKPIKLPESEKPSTATDPENDQLNMQHGLSHGCKTKDLGIPVHGELTHPKLRVRTSQPDSVREIDPSIDAGTASVSKTHDAQEKLELVLRKVTEATMQGIPEYPSPIIPPTGDASPIKDRNQQISPTMKTSQDEPTSK